MAVAEAEQQVTDRPETNRMPKLILVDPNKLKFAPYNPENRTAPDNIRDMVESLSKYGQLMPIVIRPDRTIIMGHRRCAAARALGWKSLQALVRDDLDMDVMFAEDAHTSRKMTGNDALGVWLDNPKAVPPRSAALFANMVESIGIGLTRRIHREGYSIRVFRVARQIARYVDREEDKGFCSTCVAWLMESGSAGIVGRFMTAGVDPAKLRRAVMAGKKIKLDMSVE
jgi:hypothetical protein